MSTPVRRPRSSWHLPALRQPACARLAFLHRLRHARTRSAPGPGQLVYAGPRRHGLSSPEIGPKHKPKKLLIGLLCGFAALVVIVAIVAGIFAARQASSPSTAGGAEVDRLISRYFTYFENDNVNAMLDLFLPEVIAYMQDDDTVTGRKEALIQLDDWYYDYGKAIDDYYVYDDDSLDASDVRELQRELGVRIDDNVIVACDVTYQMVRTTIFVSSLSRSTGSGICCSSWSDHMIEISPAASAAGDIFYACTCTGRRRCGLSSR